MTEFGDRLHRGCGVWRPQSTRESKRGFLDTCNMGRIYDSCRPIYHVSSRDVRGRHSPDHLSASRDCGFEGLQFCKSRRSVSAATSLWTSMPMPIVPWQREKRVIACGRSGVKKVELGLLGQDTETGPLSYASDYCALVASAISGQLRCFLYLHHIMNCCGF